MSSKTAELRLEVPNVRRMQSHSPNISKIFLLPMLKINKATTDRFSNFGFINTFTICSGQVHEFDPLYLVFKPEMLNANFYAFSHQLEKNQNHIETIDMEEYVMFVFKIPSRFTEDYEKIKHSRYQFTSPEFKALIPRTYRLMEDGGWKTLPTVAAELFEGVSIPWMKYCEHEETLIW